MRPTSPSEVAYNRAHVATRNTVERQFGLWKRRFPCLHLELRTKLENTATIIIACAVLHNIAIDSRDQPPHVDELPGPEAAIQIPEEVLLHDETTAIR